MYDLSYDTPYNKSIASQLHANRIRQNMMFPQEPMHIQPHGIWAGGWHYSPTLLAGTNANYPQLHMREAMGIASAGGMYGGGHFAYGMHPDAMELHIDRNHGVMGEGGKKSNLLRKIGNTIKKVGSVAKQVVNNPIVKTGIKALAPAVIGAIVASNPELAPLAPVALTAVEGYGRKRGRPRGGGITGGKKASVLKQIGNFGKKVVAKAKQVINSPEFAGVKAEGKKYAKKQLQNAIVEVAPQIKSQFGNLGTEALAYGANQADKQIEGAGFFKNGRPRKSMSGGKKKSFFKQVADVGKKVAQKAKAVWNDPAFAPVKAEIKKEGRVAIGQAVNMAKPYASSVPLGDVALDYAGAEANKQLAASGRKKKCGAGRSGGGITGGARDGRAARAEIVKKVMREKGLKMIEASKYVKAHGLY